MRAGEMKVHLFIVAAASVCFSLPAFYGAYRGKKLVPAVWVAWGWICGELALAGAMYIGGMGQ